jgi:hypothetical protein
MPGEFRGHRDHPDERTVTRLPVGVLVAVMAMAGCAAPAAEEGGLSASDKPTPSASASANTASAAPAPTATPTAAPTVTPTLAFAAPDGFLPPNSIVEVVVDRLQLREEPGLAGPVEGFASKGDRLSVAGWFGPVKRDGLDWYRLGPAIGGDLDAWAAAGSGADRYLEVVPPDCPSGTPDLVTLINVSSDWDRLACLGDHSLSLEGTFGCGICDGALPGEFEPFWLTSPLAGSFLWVDFEAAVGPLVVHAAPDFELPLVGSIVRATGHFSDPASTTCAILTFVGGQATEVDQRTAELYCRERFVLEAIEVIGTDPSYTDPYNP